MYLLYFKANDSHKLSLFYFVQSELYNFLCERNVLENNFDISTTHILYLRYKPQYKWNFCNNIRCEECTITQLVSKQLILLNTLLNTFVINDIFEDNAYLHHTAAFIASVCIPLQCLCQNIQNKTWKSKHWIWHIIIY